MFLSVLMVAAGAILFGVLMAALIGTPRPGSKEKHS